MSNATSLKGAVYEQVARIGKVLRKGDVLVLDVRPKEEYEAGYIRGAVSMPLKDLEKRLAELPRSQTIAAYCRGPYCMFAVKAAEAPRRKGYDAVVLKESLQDWKATGYHVEAGPAKVRAAQGMER